MPEKTVIKFTDPAIKALRRRKQRYIAWKEAGDGFGIRVSPKGKKSWIYMYRHDGKARMMTLGEYPSMSLSEAGIAHAEAKYKAEKKEDPATEKVQTNVEQRTAETVEELAALYLEKWAKRRKKTWQEDERILNKDVVPMLGRMKAINVKRRDIIALMDKIAERGSPIQANRTLATVRKMFNYAISRDIVEVNPCWQVERPGKEARRDRTLSDAEIRTFWTKLQGGDLSISKPIRIALSLLLLTSQRKSEVASMEWSDIDLKGGWWTIPATKSKNGLTHRVPLTDKAISLLEEAQELSKGKQWVFPSPTRPKPIEGQSVNRAVLNNREAWEIEPFTPHDLRRTAASQMASMGISRLVIGKVLNHVESSVTAVYDRHSYDQEKRHALEAWAKKLEAILTGEKHSNVIDLVS